MSGVAELSDPVAFVTAFSRLLRERGLDATPATSIVAVPALVAVDTGERAAVSHALRAVFVSRRAEVRLCDAVFDEWWGAPSAPPSTERAARSPRANPPVVSPWDEPRTATTSTYLTRWAASLAEAEREESVPI